VKKIQAIKSSHSKPWDASFKPITNYLGHEATYYSNLLIWNEKRQTLGLPSLSNESIGLVERILSMITNKVSYWPSRSGSIFGQNMGIILATARSLGYCGNPVVDNTKHDITFVADPLENQRKNISTKEKSLSHALRVSQRLKPSTIMNDSKNNVNDTVDTIIKLLFSETKTNLPTNKKKIPIKWTPKFKKTPNARNRKKKQEFGLYECVACNEILKNKPALIRHLNKYHKSAERDTSLDEIDYEKRHWPLLPGSFESGKHR
jgi:hypothetical protein